MPVSLRDLVGGNREVSIPFGKETLHLTYDPKHYTYTEEETLNAIIAEERETGGSRGAKHSINRFLGLVKKWDLVDYESKVIPLTEEGLRDVPRLAIDELYVKVLADMRAEDAAGKT